MRSIQNPFNAAEIFEIIDLDGNIVAVAKSKLFSSAITQDTNQHNLEVANASDIVIL